MDIDNDDWKGPLSWSEIGSSWLFAVFVLVVLMTVISLFHDQSLVSVSNTDSMSVTLQNSQFGQPDLDKAKLNSSSPSSATGANSTVSQIGLAVDPVSGSK